MEVPFRVLNFIHFLAKIDLINFTLIIVYRCEGNDVHFSICQNLQHHNYFSYELAKVGSTETVVSFQSEQGQLLF